MIEAKSFGEMNFGHAQLGDKRRTKRLVQLVDQMCSHPGGTLPQKFRNPADLQAFYRLMRPEEVTHEAIMDAHRQATFQRIAQVDGPVLIVHDATELDYTTHKSWDGMGQIGCGTRKGYIVQNSLAIQADNREVLGLVNQVLHQRANVSKSETKAQRKKRESRESLLWVKGVQPLPTNNWNLIDVCDRGADTIEFIEHEISSGRRFVIRSAHDRRILIGHGPAKECKSSKLREHVREQVPIGTWTLEVTSRVELRRGKGKEEKKLVTRQARQANMAVSFAAVQLTARGRGKNAQALKVWVIRVWEIDPPAGQERLEWFLISNEPVDGFEAAYRVVGWYESRWIVEEYHKGMKTGCKIESPQFTSEDRLQPAIAVLSVVTLTLLQLREAARRPDATTRKAKSVIAVSYVDMLSLWRHKRVKRDWTVHEFFYALARLGGHQNRKHDHQPGWQVLWEGWKLLLPMVAGYETAKSKYQKCG